MSIVVDQLAAVPKSLTKDERHTAAYARPSRSRRIKDGRWSVISQFRRSRSEWPRRALRMQRGRTGGHLSHQALILLLVQRANSGEFFFGRRQVSHGLVRAPQTVMSIGLRGIKLLGALKRPRSLRRNSFVRREPRPYRCRQCGDPSCSQLPGAATLKLARNRFLRMAMSPR